MDCSEGQNSSGGMHISMDFASRNSTRCSGKQEGTPPLTLPAGGGERSHFEIAQHSLLLTRPAFRETTLFEPNLWGFYQNFPDPGKGKDPTPAPLNTPAISSHLKGGARTEKQPLSSQSRGLWTHQETETQQDCRALLPARFPSSAGLFTMPPATQDTMSRFQHKIIKHSKRKKKISLKRRSEHQNQVRHGRKAEMIRSPA